MEYRPRLNESEYNLIREYRGILNASEKSGVNLKNVKHGWLKSNNHSLFFTNPEHESPDFDITKVDFSYIVDKTPIVEHNPENVSTTGIFDRLVYTDTHIGLNPNPNGYSLYGGVYNETEVNTRLEAMVNFVVLNKKSDTLIVDDLGDFMDGWDAKTVRREHDLKQNMDNQKAFDVGLSFKWKMFISLLNNYDKLIFNNVCNDNHSGAFGYVVNSAFKSMVEKSEMKNVTVTNHRKFINHYRIFDNIFIISHGKDDENLKFGFKPKLDKAQSSHIDNYIDSNYLLQPKVNIEFSKGDSHQLLFDWCTSDRFDYFNYPAFSPASNWIQTNYQIGKSGFVFFNYMDTKTKTLMPYFFDWKTN